MPLAWVNKEPGGSNGVKVPSEIRRKPWHVIASQYDPVIAPAGFRSAGSLHSLKKEEHVEPGGSNVVKVPSGTHRNP